MCIMFLSLHVEDDWNSHLAARRSIVLYNDWAFPHLVTQHYIDLTQLEHAAKR